MRLLFDTHLLLWLAASTARLPRAARALIDDEENQLHFSVVSIWEVAIKQALGRDKGMIDPTLLQSGLIDAGYIELPIISSHALWTMALPSLHRDPFDRMLVAQATVEGMMLVTSDTRLSKYPGPLRFVSSS